MIKPLGKRILVQKQEKPQKTGLLILQTNNNEPFECFVLAVGPKSDLDIKHGDIVLIPPYSYIPVPGQEHLLLVDDSQIIGVVEQE